jgi:hypothetical protein
MEYKKTVFSFTTLLNPNLLGFKYLQIHFQNFEKNPLHMAENSTQKTGITFAKLKPE